MKNFKFFIKLFLIFFLFTSGEIFIYSQEKNSPSQRNITSKKNTVSSPEKKTTTEKNQLYKYKEPEMPSFGSPVITFLKTLFSIILIIFLIYITVFFLKFFLSKKPQFFSSGLINIIESFYIGTNKSIHIIDIAEDLYVIGISEKGMDLLKEITNEETKQFIRSKMTDKRDIFKNYISEFTKKFSSTPKQDQEDKKILVPDSKIKDIIKNFRENISK